MYFEIKEETPLISVITPAYNAEAFIADTIDSVEAQTLSNWELIVIDDASEDLTKNIVAEYVKDDARIKLISNEHNMGVAKTRNRGLGMFRGKYVAFLDSDDYWAPEMLEKMVARAEETNADIVYCSYSLVDENGHKVCNDFIVPEETSFEASIVRSVITCSTVLLTADLAAKVCFPTNVYHEDIALWFQLLKDGYVARGVTEILAYYRQHTDSRSAGKIKSACRRWVIYRKHLKLPFIMCVSKMCKYTFYGLKKYKRI